MSGTSLDLIDSGIYEVDVVNTWTELQQRYAQGWRCIHVYMVVDDPFFVLERPVR